MEKKTLNGIIVVSIVLIGGYFAYKKLIKPDSRKVLIKYLDATFGIDAEHTTFINNADKKYVDSWAKALMKGESTFTYNGKTYNTGGGTAA
jgi:hypothetical protein